MTTDSFVSVRRDYRRCMAPLCGGYWVKDLNRSTAERYVSALDFSLTFLDENDQQAVTGAPDRSVVLYGRLGKRDSGFYTRAFTVAEAYRALPGASVESGDQFYTVNPTKIACITTPCHNLQAERVNRATGSKMVSSVDVTDAQMSLVDSAWLTNRATYGRAVVAGSVVKRKGALVLDASQIFLRLPDRATSCPKPSIAECPEGLVHGWTRDENRCLMPTGCLEPLFCIAMVPSCDEGYTLVSWENQCTQYACDPEFVY